MLFALLLALAAIAGATLLTYLYDREALAWSRLCAGVCLGFALLGLVGFVVASFAGMNAASLAVAGVVCGSPLLLLARGGWRGRVGEDITEGARVFRAALTGSREGRTGALVFYAAAALVFWFVFAHAMYETPAGIFTCLDTNLGDLPFHFAVVSGFAYGENFPPQHPEFAGVRLTYPFVVDFLTAMFVRAGASLEGAMFWQNYVTMLALVGLLHRWAWTWTRERVAAMLTPALILLSGGFGWWVFVSEAAKGDVFSLLGNLQHDYTVMGHVGYQWPDSVTALFVPQRSILLGVALATVVMTLWWQASEKAKVKRRKAKEGVEEGSLSGSAGVGRKKGAADKKATGKKRAKGGGKSARDQSKREATGAVSDPSDANFNFCLSPFALRPLIAAGLVAGLLPLVHAHSFVVVMLMGACLALFQGVVLLVKGSLAEDGEARDDAAGGVEARGDVASDETTRGSSLSRLWAVWLPWVVFAAAASLLALPQMVWATRDSGVRAGQFFGWEFGWAHGEENVVWFWLKNTGVFIPLLVAALAWPRRERLVSNRLLFFFLPFLLCFVVPNVYKLSPWIWDNVKILIYWWIASAPLVALVLARLWRRRGARRALALALLFAQTAAGALDVWRAAYGATERQEYDAAALAFADVIKGRTEPRSLILHAPTYNDPVYLTGRRTFLGYPGHVWSHGIDFSAREADLKAIYTGSPAAASLIAKDRIEYVVVGPREREEMRQRGLALDEAFFSRYAKVGEAGGFILYKTKP
jgi:hypothetical protein